MSFADAVQAYCKGDYANAGALIGGSTDSDSLALSAMSTVRGVLNDGRPRSTLDSQSLSLLLSPTLSTPRLEGERCFIRGWLCWLDGAFAGAAALLGEAVRVHREHSESAARAEAAYWRSRCLLQLSSAGGVSEYEEEMPTLGGLPQSVVWFVDLLWRSRSDRVHQVWKTVRLNPRVTAREETFLIDARLLLRHDLAGAEQLLQEAAPRGGVLQTERLLYLALVKIKRGRPAEAADLVNQAERGLYPSSAVRAWRRLLPLQPETAEPPPGTPAGPWRLHKAAQALGRGDPALGLRWLNQANRDGIQKTDLIEAAMPELRRLARSQKLAEAVRFTDQQPTQAPGLLNGAVSCLEHETAGRAALEAAERGDQATAQALLRTIAASDNLQPDTAHHLAITFQCGAVWTESKDAVRADQLWRSAWRCWLRWAETANLSDRGLVFTWLLAEHRQNIKELLARNAVEEARRHWQRVMDLAENRAPAKRIDAFRDELATEYLVMAREAMRYGSISAGYDADYATGLNWLVRLLSLDRDNRRLLMELVSICTEWFQECYGVGDLQQLSQGVERFTPFALHLGRQIEQSDSAELTARAVLADFTKYRAFVTDDPARKADLYAEAQRWHPTHGRPNTGVMP
jgi:tetratricopeptide (TPR) repeat protein